MSMGSSWQRFSKPSAPERGAFPLDIEKKCTTLVEQYKRCIKSSKGVNNPACRELAKGYLECRMEHDLMVKDDFRNLGFRDILDSKSSSSTEQGNGPRKEMSHQQADKVTTDKESLGR